MTKIVKGFQEFKRESVSERGTTGRSGSYGIFESGSGNVIDAQQKEALEQAVRDGRLTQAQFDHLMNNPDEVGAALVALGSGIQYVQGGNFSTVGTSGTSGTSNIANTDDFWVKAARTAGKGRRSAFAYYDGSDPSTQTGSDREVQRYFSPSHGTSGSGKTIGNPGSAIIFSEDSPNSVGTSSTTQDITNVLTRRYPTDAKNKLKVPDYSELGEPSFSKSNFFTNVKEELAVSKKRRKIINALKKNKIIDDGVNLEEDNVLVAVRMPPSIKERYANDFTDLFFLFTGNDRNVEVFLGSTTPSPAFRYKDWYEFYVKIGIVGLIQQKGSYILDDGTYLFKVSSSGTKVDFLGTPLLVQDGGVRLHRYDINSESIGDAKKALGYKPNVELEANQTPPIFIAPAVPFPQEAKSLDATTSGDQVIRRSQDFGKILKAGSGGLKYILKTLPENFGMEEDGSEEE